MKKFFNLKTTFILLSVMLLSLVEPFVFAQDSSGSSSSRSTTTTVENTTTIQPWMWVVGGAVLLIIIIALVRGGGSGGRSHTDKVTYTKTTSEDNA
ncbi:MAG: hypothetical protein ABI472_08155 [Ginsengibacter sp.]